MATSKEYIDPKSDSFGGIVVSEELGTDIPKDAIKESVIAKKPENETENNDKKKQSGKATIILSLLLNLNATKSIERRNQFTNLEHE